MADYSIDFALDHVPGWTRLHIMQNGAIVEVVRDASRDWALREAVRRIEYRQWHDPLTEQRLEEIRIARSQWHPKRKSKAPRPPAVVAIRKRRKLEGARHGWALD